MYPSLLCSFDKPQIKPPPMIFFPSPSTTFPLEFVSLGLPWLQAQFFIAKKHPIYHFFPIEFSAMAMSPHSSSSSNCLELKLLLDKNRKDFFCQPPVPFQPKWYNTEYGLTGPHTKELVLRFSGVYLYETLAREEKRFIWHIKSWMRQTWSSLYEVFDIVRKIDRTLASQNKKGVSINWTLRGNNTRQSTGGNKMKSTWRIWYMWRSDGKSQPWQEQEEKNPQLPGWTEQERMSSVLSIPHNGWRWDGWTSQSRPRMTHLKPGDAGLQNWRLVGLVQDGFHYKCLWMWLKCFEQRYYNTIQ